MGSRAQRFDDCVLDAMDHLAPRVEGRVDDVQLAVQLVPVLDDDVTSVPLAQTRLRDGGPQIVLYRRVIEARACSEEELAELVARVLTEQVAALLLVDPHDLDEDYEP